MLKESAIKHKVRVRVPVVKRGFFGRKKIVYEERTILVDFKTYRRIMKEKADLETEDLMDFIDEMEMIDAIFDD